VPGENEPADRESDRRRSRWRAWRSIREILGIIWGDAEPFVKGRLMVVLLLVIAASVLTALGRGRRGIRRHRFFSSARTC
jgi:hypothetical protein